MISVGKPGAASVYSAIDRAFRYIEMIEHQYLSCRYEWHAWFNLFRKQTKRKIALDFDPTAIGTGDAFLS